MRLTLTETQTLLESSALHWLAGNADAMRDASEPDKYWSMFAEMGWLALPHAEAVGGFGGGPIEVGLLMRALGRHRTGAAPYRNGVLMAARALDELGTRVQRDTWLAGLMAGEQRMAMAHAEPGQENPWRLPSTVATWNAHTRRWTLRGKKSMVVGAGNASAIIVSAAIHANPSRLGLFVLPINASGLASTPCSMADGNAAIDILLNDVTVDEAAQLGTDSAAAEVTDTFVALVGEALIASCWEATGAMRAALEATVSHVTQREQFGRTLASFQSVQHRLAEMAVCCEEAAAACELAALRVAADRRLACNAASMAKSCTSRAARYVAANAVQLHGGMGVSEELHVAGLFRLLTRFQLEDGHADWHAARLGAAMSVGDWRHSQTLLAPTTSIEPPVHKEETREWICN
ncbi:acyl-CoA dehydrogenase family protein [Cupriavidus pauculus]|uniref:Acyl-CoA dehydrogenase n=1 Tax=Cupriavidus pauculus TaxID=82633 RepID=A0A2N5C8C7_9BURK|nr:acyl-CoA dehydrogenase family protein [Cupriavidus pauculus]PLP98460.1 acyl-CoA dehydrogenase [Cupriavidus pauculus]